MEQIKQNIKFCSAPDGVRLAYATIGEGPPLVRVSTYMTHLEYDRKSPVWYHWLRDLSRNYTFVRYLENIERHFDKYVIDLNRDNLRKKAQKDFPLMFEGYEEENKINFLLLKEMFVHLRNYNTLVKREWIELGKSIGVINFADGGKALFQQLDNIVAESTGYCKQTDIFLHAVAAILSLPADDFDILERDMNNRLVYHDYFNYSLENMYSFVPEVRVDLTKQGQVE